MYIQPKNLYLKEIAHNDYAALVYLVLIFNRLRKNIHTKARKNVLLPHPTNINEVPYTY